MKRILIVDDEAPLRLLCKVTLEKRGYAVDDAPDGEAALKKLAAAPYDLVVTDMTMPGSVDGLGVVREASARRIPSILCTAYQTEEVKSAAALATQILEKPVPLKTLADAVEKLLA